MTDPDFNFAQYFPDEEHKLGEFLKRRGDPLNCRIDLRLTSLEELKKAAVLISQVNGVLNKLAYEDERDAVLRVMLARDALQHIRFHLKYAKPPRGAKVERKKDTTRSVSWPVQVGNLDRPWKRSESSE